MRAALGFGVSGPHGHNWFSERKLARLIAQAIDGGVRRFDTAPFYGEAEARLGRALKSAGANDVIISTKTGTRREGGRLVKDFSERSLRADAEMSLTRLQRDVIDVLYLHGPTLAEIDAALPTLRALKAEGKVKAVGVCGEGAALDHAVVSGVDAVMGVYNVINRGHAAVFARARSSGIKTVAIAPLAQGAIAPRKIPHTPSNLWRVARQAVRGGPAKDLRRRARLAFSGIRDFVPSGAALAFVLQEGAADLVLTTTTNARHLVGSLAAARRSLDPDMMSQLLALALDPDASRS